MTRKEQNIILDRLKKVVGEGGDTGERSRD